MGTKRAMESEPTNGGNGSDDIIPLLPIQNVTVGTDSGPSVVDPTNLDRDSEVWYRHQRHDGEFEAAQGILQAHHGLLPPEPRAGSLQMVRQDGGAVAQPTARASLTRLQEADRSAHKLCRTSSEL